MITKFGELPLNSYFIREDDVSASGKAPLYERLDGARRQINPARIVQLGYNGEKTYKEIPNGISFKADTSVIQIMLYR